MRTLTVRQLYAQVRKHKYIIVQFQNDRFALNCAIAKLLLKFHGLSGDESRFTNIVSFKPCSFQEYISRKIHFYARSINK